MLMFTINTHFQNVSHVNPLYESCWLMNPLKHLLKFYSPYLFISNIQKVKKLSTRDTMNYDISPLISIVLTVMIMARMVFHWKDVTINMLQWSQKLTWHVNISYLPYII